MSKETGVILIGIWVFILPFLGIPGSWRATLLTITGIGLVLLGFFLRSEAMSRGGAHPKAPFRDSEHETSVGKENR